MPMRVNYFDKQFLKVNEFTDEQAYHLGARRRLTQAFQRWGIVWDPEGAAEGEEEALQVHAVDATHVRVSPGLAIDRAGREIVYEDKDARYALPEVVAGQPVYVTIVYQEKKDPRSKSTSADAPQTETRWIEDGLVALTASKPPDDGRVIPLAKFTPVAGAITEKPGEVLDGGVRRYAGAKRLAAGARAVGDLAVQGKLAVDGDVSTKGTIKADGDVAVNGNASVQGNLSLGSATAENAEQWHRVLELSGGGNARFSLRTTGTDGTTPIDARAFVHGKGWWGAKPGLVIGTKTADEVSLAAGGTVKMRVTPNAGVLFTSPLVVVGPNTATFADASVTANLRVSGEVLAQTISSPKWQAKEVFSNVAQALPFSGSLQTSGGTLLVFLHGSAWAPLGHVSIGITVSIAGASGSTSLWVNPGLVGQHVSLPGVTLVFKGIGAGNHPVSLTHQNTNTRTDGADYFSVTVLELPF